jgi:hypothetical protein
MDDSNWERWGGLGGILFIILVVIAAVLPGSPPKTSDSAAKIAKWVVDHDDKIRYAGYLGAIATIPFLWWMSSLWRMLRRAEGGSPRLTVMAGLGAAFATVFGALGGVLLAVLPIAGVKELGLGGTRTFYILATDVGVLTLIGVAVLVIAASTVFLRSRVLPAAVGWFGALVAVVTLVGAYATVSTSDTIFTLTFVGFALATLWLLIVSIFMLRGTPDRVEAA